MWRSPGGSRRDTGLFEEDTHVTKPWRLQRIAFFALIIVASMLLLAACGDDDDDDDDNGDNGGAEVTATSDSGGDMELSGSIDIDGSSTVFPISEGVAEEFAREYSDVQITVGFSGTGGGFEKFCTGETQISDASRPVRDSEIEECGANGIEMTEFRVAIDGLSVVVNPANDWITCLTVEQLTMMFEPDSGVTTWADIDASWPDEEITFYIPGTDSGTFDYFTETSGGEAGATRTENIVTSEDDNVLVQGVESDEHAIGYFGYAYYIENQDRMKVVQVDNGDGCVEPAEDTVNSGEYAPLSRPLFIYADNAAIQEREEVAEFIRYYMTDGRIVTGEVGYVEYPDEIYQENLDNLETVIGGGTVEMWSRSMSEGDDEGSAEEPTATEEMAEEPTATEAAEEEPTATEEEMMDLSGSIDIDGSSTVFPISEGVAEEFAREYSDVQITVGFSGTGGGFEKFCAGETQISDASRPVKDEEIEACAENGIEMTEFQVAIDGLSVVVNPANDWVTCLTVDHLTQLFGPESTVTNWSDVDPSWPDEEITFYIPGTDSGTFDYFTETIGGESGATRTENIVTSEDDNVLVQGVESDEYGIAYFGYAYYIENQDRMKVVPVDNGDGCVEPTEDTVNSGEYAPLSRPLFIYVRNDALAEDDTVRAFVHYYMTEGRVVISQVGYVEYPDEVYEENLSMIDAAAS